MFSNGFDVSLPTTPTLRQRSFKNSAQIPPPSSQFNIKGKGNSTTNSNNSYFHNKATKKMKIDQAVAINQSERVRVTDPNLTAGKVVSL